MAQRGRPALGPLDQNKLRRPQHQKLQTNKTNVLNDEDLPANNVTKDKPVQPPVAQFQAFSVYESTSKKSSCITKVAAKVNAKQKDARIPLGVLELPSQRYVKSPAKSDIESELLSPIVSDSSDCSKSVVESNKKRNEEKKATAKTLREQFFHVSQYREDIYSYMKKLELKYKSRHDYMRKQADITYSMRAILVDWLVEVSEEYRLQTETLYLAVSYIDRFLSYMSVVRAKLQLVGTTAMFIAAKFEEIYPPELKEFVYITDETYTKQQVLRMEHLILKVLSFDLATPTPLAFISLFCISNGYSQKTLYLAMYISELALLEAEPYLQYTSSILGASALAVARHALFCCHCSGNDLLSTSSKSSVPAPACTQAAWPESLIKTSGYELSDLESCVRELVRTHSSALKQPHQAIVEKYKSNDYDGVAHIEPKSMYLRTEFIKYSPLKRQSVEFENKTEKK